MTNPLLNSDFTRLSPYPIGLIHYTNMAPILDDLEIPEGVEVIKGVPIRLPFSVDNRT